MLTTEYLMSLSYEEKKEAIWKERLKCATDYKYLIETYFTVDNAGTTEHFILYPHQVNALDAYIKYSNNISMKSRQMGFTTFTSAFAAAEMISNSGYKVVIISKEMNSAMEFVRKIKEILDNARNNTRMSNREGSLSWLVPEYEDGYNNKRSFRLANDSFVEGQGNSEDAGRGVSALNLCIVDEVAFIDRKSPERMNEIWAAIGPALSTTGGKAIMISTPFGTQGWYYETYVNADTMGFNIIDAHWSMHPIFNKGMYRWIVDPTRKTGGYIKFYNKEWPEYLEDAKTKQKIKIPKQKYEFICDGKLRSPWYDGMSRRLGPKKTSRELDCTFAGTGGEVLPQELIRDMDINAKATTYAKVYKKGHLGSFKEFSKPIPGKDYMLSVDVMTGDGSDFSTVVILEMNGEFPPKIIGTLKLQVQPKFFAKIIAELARRYNDSLIVVENQGGGSTVLQELQEMKVRNIYWSTLKKKDESTGQAKRKIGFWQDENTRIKGGDELEVLLIERDLEIPCSDLVLEFYTWIWDRDGKRRHAPGKHDDMIMALQNAIYVWKYYYRKKLRRAENFQRIAIATSSSNHDMEEMLDPLLEEKEIIMKQKLINNKINKEKGTARYIPKIFFQ